MTFQLQVRRRQVGAKDKHGNKVTTYASPEPWTVRGYAPGANVEANANLHRDLSIILWTVYADASDDAPGELDHVLINGVEYAVEGRPADWTHGPWHNPVAGIVVELKRAEG
jgi:hypothetical protein